MCGTCEDYHLSCKGVFLSLIHLLAVNVHFASRSGKGHLGFINGGQFELSHSALVSQQLQTVLLRREEN